MPLFFHKTQPKVIRAYSLEDCPKPEEWTATKPEYTEETEEDK